jgi:hypothetical protein
VSVETAVLAASGHTPSIDAIKTSLEGQRDAFKEATDAGKLNMEERDKELGKLAESNTAYKKLTEGIAQGRAVADVYSQSLLDLIATPKDATVQTDELGNQVYNLPGGKQIFIDAKTGQASENIDRFKGDLDTIPAQKATTVKVGVDSREWDNWRPTIKTGWVRGVPQAV